MFPRIIEPLKATSGSQATHKLPNRDGVGVAVFWTNNVALNNSPMNRPEQPPSGMDWPDKLSIFACFFAIYFFTERLQTQG
jgi:hypothetical protein